MISSVPFVLISFVISACAFSFCAAKLFKNGIPMYFKLYAIATGCYAIEELWVLVNAVFGTEGSYASVRLFGIFGFFAFILSANSGEFDRVTDEGVKGSKAAAKKALIAPLALFLLYIVSVVLTYAEDGFFKILLELAVLSPTFPASYYTLKHRFLPPDEMGMLCCVKGTDIVTLAIFLLNSVYTFDIIDKIPIILYSYDIIMAMAVLMLAVESTRGAEKWKTLL